jgi:hypothetical protein
MGRGSNVVPGIVQDKVFEMRQITIHPKRCTGIGEVASVEETLADRRTRQPFIKSDDGSLRARER